MLRGIFVTGTDTNIGKTVVSAALMHRYRELGTIRYWKPVQTGIEQDDDTETVRSLGQCADVEIFPAGVRLFRPLAPYLAAELSGTRVAVSDLAACIADQPAQVRWVVEGIGGVLVPFNEAEFVTDLIVSLNMPVLIVSHSGLGTINQTLLTIEALRARTINIAGVVMVGPRNPENREAVERWGAVRVIAEMPRFSELTPGALDAWAALEFDIEGELAGCFE